MGKIYAQAFQLKEDVKFCISVTVYYISNTIMQGRQIYDSIFSSRIYNAGGLLSYR